MKNPLPIAIIIAGIIIAGVVVYVNYQKCVPGTCPEAGRPPAVQSQALSSQEAGERVMKYINENILQGRATASLINVLEENGLLYKVTFDIQGNEIETYLTLDGKFFFPEGVNLTEVEKPAQETEQTIGNFSVSSDEVCKENEKPIIYFFGSQGCPHCVWEHPIVEEVAKKFEGYISFHNNMDSEADGEIFQKYSTGGIPTLVLGCKYYRVGSGEAAGKEQEIKDLTSLICELTNNQPADVCQE